MDNNYFNGVDVKDFHTVSIKGSGNLITVEDGAILTSLKVTIRGSNNRIIIGKNCELRGIVFIKGDNNIISFGDNTTSADTRFTLGGKQSIKVGEGCMFSRKIEVRSWDEHPIYDIESKQQINISNSVEIGNYVWIGVGVEIGKGSKIPDGCVIGARSVVTKELFEKNSIYVGSPVRLVRTGIIWGRTPKSTPWDRVK